MIWRWKLFTPALLFTFLQPSKNYQNTTFVIQLRLTIAYVEIFVCF